MLTTSYRCTSHQSLHSLGTPSDDSCGAVLGVHSVFLGHCDLDNFVDYASVQQVSKYFDSMRLLTNTYCSTDNIEYNSIFSVCVITRKLVAVTTLYGCLVDFSNKSCEYNADALTSSDTMSTPCF